MSLVSISNQASNRPYLKQGGEYGPGRAHEADVECTSFDFCTGEGEGPAYDRNCTDDKAAPYAKFVFRVDHAEFGMVPITHFEPCAPNSGSKTVDFVNNLTGGAVQPDENGNPSFDPAIVAPRKCAIQVLDPRQDKEGRWWNGRIIGVFGI